MATARPSMSARVCALEAMSTNDEATVMAHRAMPTPTIADTRGNPAATSEPKVLTRTKAATSRPISSAALLCSSSSTALPPRLIFRLAFSPLSATWCRASDAAGVMSACGTA